MTVSRAGTGRPGSESESESLAAASLSLTALAEAVLLRCGDSNSELDVPGSDPADSENLIARYSSLSSDRTSESVTVDDGKLADVQLQV